MRVDQLLLRLPTRRPDAAGRRALARYDDLPAKARLHVAIRWLSCPMAPIEAELPLAGRILEVGCGHGLFSIYGAESGVERSVTGVDIDADKIALAQAAAAGLPGRVTFSVADGTVPPGPWEAIVIVDVLYLVEPAAAQALLASCREQLAPGGVLVVKEMALTPRWKAQWNRLQEWLAVRVLRITEGDTLSFVSTDAVAGWLTAAGMTVRPQRLDRHRLHPHALIVATAPGAAA